MGSVLVRAATSGLRVEPVLRADLEAAGSRPPSGGSAATLGAFAAARQRFTRVMGVGPSAAKLPGHHLVDHDAEK
jgi:hypothetical protein